MTYYDGLKFDTSAKVHLSLSQPLTRKLSIGFPLRAPFLTCTRELSFSITRLRRARLLSKKKKKKKLKTNQIKVLHPEMGWFILEWASDFFLFLFILRVWVRHQSEISARVVKIEVPVARPFGTGADYEPRISKEEVCLEFWWHRRKRVLTVQMGGGGTLWTVCVIKMRKACEVGRNKSCNKI